MPVGRTRAAGPGAGPRAFHVALAEGRDRSAGVDLDGDGRDVDAADAHVVRHSTVRVHVKCRKALGAVGHQCAECLHVHLAGHDEARVVRPQDGAVGDLDQGRPRRGRALQLQLDHLRQFDRVEVAVERRVARQRTGQEHLRIVLEVQLRRVQCHGSVGGDLPSHAVAQRDVFEQVVAQDRRVGTVVPCVVHPQHAIGQGPVVQVNRAGPAVLLAPAARGGKRPG